VFDFQGLFGFVHVFPRMAFGAGSSSQDVAPELKALGI
jgi:hypothetical protein